MARVRYIAVFALSALLLLWERLWARVWPAASVTLFGAALALVGLPAWLGPAGHLAFLLLFIAAFMAAFFYGGAPFRWPRTADVQRQMERASDLPHRPLQTLADHPEDGLSQGARTLWQKHRQDAAAALAHLKVYTPQTDMAARDRWALRYIALLAFIVGLAIAQGQAGARLLTAFNTDIFHRAGGGTSLAFDLWITPPEYTHTAATYLATARQGVVARTGAVSVPEGSLLKLRLAGPRFTPTLTYAGEKQTLAEPAPRNYTLDLPLQQSGNLTLRALFAALGQWALNVVPDAAPAVHISKIETSPRGTARIAYTAEDDYGVTRLTAMVMAEDDAFSFSLLPPDGKGGSALHVEDLAASPAAGMEATLTLEAADGAGHTSASAPMTFTLPERVFSNPLAKRVAQNRKILLRFKNPLSVSLVRRDLAALAQQPDLYKGDIVVFMALSTAVRRLGSDTGELSARNVARLLWDVALRLEDGGLSRAQQELSATLQKLRQALADKNTSKDELRALIDEAQKKMREYVKSLARDMQQRTAAGQKPMVISPELAQKFMQSLDLNKLLEQMRQMSQASSREELEQVTQNLQKMLDSLSMPSSAEMQEQQAKAMEALQEMEDAIRLQQSLFDKTNKTADSNELKALKKEQEAARAKLGEALRKLGASGAQIPENFARADQAMKKAEGALGEGNRGESLTQQKAALDELQKGLDGAVQQMAQSLFMTYDKEGSSGFGQGFDPLGRQNGSPDNDTVKLPGEKERRRVQQIIEELRSRSNEPNRTKVERDYIDRLLEPF